MTSTKRRGKKQPKKEVVTAELVSSSDVRDIAVPTGTVLDAIRERRRDPRDRLRDLFRQWRSDQMVATMISYQADLVDFARFFKVPESKNRDAMAERVAQDFLSLDREEATSVFIAYRTDLIKKKRAAATINRRLSAIYSLVGAANSGAFIDWELPRRGMLLRPKLSRDVSGPGPEVYAKILDSIEASASGGLWISKARSLRDIAMLRLLHDLGLRRIEVLRLDLDDVKFSKHKICVQGKGDEEKSDVPLVNARTVLALARWIKCRGTGHHGNDENNPLFVSFSNRAKGERLSLRSLNWIVRERAIEAGFVREGCRKREEGKWCSCCGKLPPDEPGGKMRPISPHGFRHTSITTLMNASGKDLAKVQAFSRHKSLDMLGRYDDARFERSGDAQEMLAQATEPAARSKKTKAKGRKR